MALSLVHFEPTQPVLCDVSFMRCVSSSRGQVAWWHRSRLIVAWPPLLCPKPMATSPCSAPALRRSDFIFPLRLRGGKPTPFTVWLMAAVFCIYNGFMQAGSFFRSCLPCDVAVQL